MVIGLFDEPNTPSTLRVKVTPNAKSSRIKVEYNADGSIDFYRVYVTVPPENGKANKAVIEEIAKNFDVPKSKVSIKHGFLCREKVIEISD